MGRSDIRGTDTVVIDIPVFGGQNTAKTFSEIGTSESARMLNKLPRKIGGLAKRPGTIPVTTSPLGSAIRVICNLRKAGVNNILATAGTTLYKLVAGVLTAQTMTNALVTASIGRAQFKDKNAVEALIIADGGSLKYYNGTAVANISPTANDTSPLPANVLATINSTTPAIGVLVYNTRLVVWGVNSDTLFNSKIGYFDYFEATSFQRFVSENDYIVTCIGFAGALLVLMRRHIGVRFGDGYTNPPSSQDWSQDFLDTTDGCVNANSVATVVYPDGHEEIFYQSDHGIHAIYTIDTLSLDSSARYSTKSLTKNQINFDELGLTKAEWAAAAGYFYDSRYWLVYKKGATWLGFVYNTVDLQWYPVDNLVANCFYNDDDYFYFVGDHQHVKKFDSSLNSDWNEAAKTTGTPINDYWYSKLLSPKVTGLDHFWDFLLLEARQQYGASTIDIEVNTYNGNFQLMGALKTEIFVVGVTKIGDGQIANPRLTDFVNNAKRIGMFLKGQYAQVKISNPRDEPCEFFSLQLEVRKMDKY